MNEVILLNGELHELSTYDIDVDCEVGLTDSATNDFELSNATIQGANAKGFYVPNTEIGGLFEYSKSTTESDVQVFKGWTWRGLLTQALITPPSGSDYKIVSGDANAIISSILSGVLGGFFYVPSETSVTINSYQFPLYCTVADGLELMLESVGYRLNIEAKKVSQGAPIRVEVSAVPAATISGAFNEDSQIPMIFQDNQMGVNHLLCAGQGELQSRMKVDLYIDENGNVSTTQHYTGFAERTAFYDYSSAESMDDLVDNGKKRLLELSNAKTISMQSMSNLDYTIGDKAKGLFPDGTDITKPIVKKVYKISNGILTNEISVKGEY